jgi:hypothetical protein
MINPFSYIAKLLGIKKSQKTTLEDLMMRLEVAKNFNVMANQYGVNPQLDSFLDESVDFANTLTALTGTNDIDALSSPDFTIDFSTATSNFSSLASSLGVGGDISDAIDSAVDFANSLTGNAAIDIEMSGFLGDLSDLGSEGSDRSSGISGSEPSMRGMGWGSTSFSSSRTDFSGSDGSPADHDASSPGMGGWENGGVIDRVLASNPREDGLIPVQLGEGVVSKDGMEVLGQINNGDITSSGQIIINIVTQTGKQLQQYIVDTVRTQSENGVATISARGLYGAA